MKHTLITCPDPTKEPNITYRDVIFDTLDHEVETIPPFKRVY
jgi:hypothetical protein